MNIKPVKEFYRDQLKVQVYLNREQMGRASAFAMADKMCRVIQKQQQIRIVFAAAPSQNEFLNTLSRIPNIDWSKVTAFHMDEYLGIPVEAQQRFGNFLRNRLFAKVPLKGVHYINPNPSIVQEECFRYASLLQEAPIDIVCMGIGENGHIAFNDPPVADFNDSETVKVVELDEICRKQQVNDGCFVAITDVPKFAITLTVPTLISAKTIFVVVPGPTKAQAVYNTLEGPIRTACPASILRRHKDAVLFLDLDSGAKLLPWSLRTR